MSSGGRLSAAVGLFEAVGVQLQDAPVVVADGEAPSLLVVTEGLDRAIGANQRAPDFDRTVAGDAQLLLVVDGPVGKWFHGKREEYHNG